MTQPRFVPVLDLPDDWSGAITVVVQQGQVVVLDDHPDDVAADVPRMLLGTLDGAACWAVDLDGDGVPDVVIEDLGAAMVPLMGLHGRVDDLRWTLAGRAVQLVEWDRTHRFCGRCGTPTEPAPGERARRCPACGLLAFPRLAPAVITLIERDGEALLARGRRLPDPDVQLHRRLRRARRDDGGGRAPRGARGGRRASWARSATSPASRGRSRTRS